MKETLGILGGGQLGRMMVEAANRLNLKTIVLDSGNSSAKQVSNALHVDGSFTNKADIQKIASKCSVLTVEIEHVDTDILEELSVKTHPSPATIRIIQDKYLQKEHLNKHNAPLGEFRSVENIKECQAVAAIFGYPFMLKAKRLAYDGRGNYKVDSENDIVRAFDTLTANGNQVYAEKWVSFRKEIAVLVAKSTTGQVVTYPCVETVQKDNICHLVIAPAQIDGLLSLKAQQIAENVIAAFDGAGIYAVELFLCTDDSILVNEVAPRPHNSGHFTIEACYTSQFEQHIRCVLGLPLGSPEMKVGAAVMVNIIGSGADMKQIDEITEQSLRTNGASVHLYGKPDCRKGRKMGHITIVGDDIGSILEKIPSLAAGTYSTSIFPAVGIIMGSDSDLPTVLPACEMLKTLGVPFEVDFISAHRTPGRMCEYAETASKRGLKVIIAAAGGAAHLPGMVAAQTHLPVIGIPVALKFLDGVDSLHSIVQMPVLS